MTLSLQSGPHNNVIFGANRVLKSHNLNTLYNIQLTIKLKETQITVLSLTYGACIDIVETRV